MFWKIAVCCLKSWLVFTYYYDGDKSNIRSQLRSSFKSCQFHVTNFEFYWFTNSLYWLSDFRKKDSNQKTKQLKKIFVTMDRFYWNLLCRPSDKREARGTLAPHFFEIVFCQVWFPGNSLLCHSLHSKLFWPRHS